MVRVIKFGDLQKRRLMRSNAAPKIRSLEEKEILLKDLFCDDDYDYIMNVHLDTEHSKEENF